MLADASRPMTVPCDACGALAQMDGRWGLVAERLKMGGSPIIRLDLLDVHLFGRCNTCGSMMYAPAIDILAGPMDFFQVVNPEGKLLLECVTYDVTALEGMIRGGEDEPTIQAKDPLNRSYEIVPTDDLKCGICVRHGELTQQAVTEALQAVAREYP